MHRKWAGQQGSTDLQCECDGEDKLPYKKKSRSSSAVITNPHKVTSAPDVIVNDEIKTVDSCLPLNKCSSLSHISAVNNTSDLTVEPDPWLVFEPTESEAFWGKCDNANDVWSGPQVTNCSLTEDSRRAITNTLPQQTLEKSDIEKHIEPMDCGKQLSTDEQASGLRNADCIAESNTDFRLVRNDNHEQSVETDRCPSDHDSAESDQSHGILFSVDQQADDAKLVCDGHMGRDVRAVVAHVGSDMLDCDGQTVCAVKSDSLENDESQERDDDDVDVCVVNDTEDSDVDDEQRPAWRTALKKDPYPLSEHLILSLEEVCSIRFDDYCSEREWSCSSCSFEK